MSEYKMKGVSLKDLGFKEERLFINGIDTPENSNQDEIRLNGKKYVQLACCQGKVSQVENGVDVVKGYVNGQKVEIIQDTGLVQ